MPTGTLVGCPIIVEPPRGSVKDRWGTIAPHLCCAPGAIRPVRTLLVTLEKDVERQVVVRAGTEPVLAEIGDAGLAQHVVVDKGVTGAFA
jgi:hypothetical protein